jgi:Flp pilus assembly pilin Flp
MMNRLKNPARSLTSSKGQSLAEYGLTLSLVAVVSLGGLVLLGDNLATLLSSLTQLVTGQSVNVVATANTPTSAPVSNAPSPALAVSAASPALVSPAPVENSSNPITKNAEGKTCYGNGWCIDTSQLPSSGGKTTIAAGSNGTTLMLSYADILMQIAAEAAADPNADPSVVGLITALANQGHTIADNTEKKSQSIQNQVTQMTGSLGQQSEFDGAKSKLDAYLSAHPAALPSDLKAVIDNSSAYISKNSNGIQTTVTTAFGMALGGTTVRKESNTICSSGGNTTECVK